MRFLLSTWLLLPLLLQATTRAQEEEETTTTTDATTTTTEVETDSTLNRNCATIFDCTSCLEAAEEDNGIDGCKFALGLCANQCRDDQATCYSTDLFPDASASEICAFVNADIALCQQQMSCDTCVDSVKSDGTVCQWYEQAGACFGGGTGPFGSGSITCPVVTGPVDDSPNCATFQGCSDCVSNQCAWAVGACLKDCSQIADAPCYATSEVAFQEMTPNDICAVHQTQVENNALCAGSTDCGSCTSTGFVNENDDSVNCVWFPFANLCQAVNCTSDGDCGINSCREAMDESQVCQAASTSCEACLTAECAWFASGTCTPSCSDIQDVACYAAETFPDATQEEICQLVADANANGELCFAQEDCGGCVSTLLLDNSTTCSWYFDETTGMGWCLAESGCDMNGICGSTDINACPAVTDEEVDVPPPDNGDGEVTDEELVNCNTRRNCDACLKAECAWFVTSSSGICAASCDAIVGSSDCYAPSVFPDIGSLEEICQLATGSSGGESATDDATADTTSSGNGTAVEGSGESDVGFENPCLQYDHLGADGCVACLNDENNCAWVLGTCESSCDNIADAECYSKEAYPDLTVETICQVTPDTDANQDDASLCRSKNYCFTCTTQFLSDGVTRCSWYKDEDSGEEWCDVGGCNVNGICGSSDEEICQVDTGPATTTPPPQDSSANNGDDSTVVESNSDAGSIFGGNTALVLGFTTAAAMILG